MPESIIKKVEQFGKSNAQPNTLKLIDRNGILFKWNDNVDEYPQGLVEEGMILYPSFAAEISRVVLEQDLPIPTIEDEIKPQSHAKDAAAHNANLELFEVAGVDAPMIIRANNDEINVINDDNNDILSIATIPATNNHGPLILPNTSDSDRLDNEGQCEDKGDDEDNLSNYNLDGQEAEKSEEGLTEDQYQGVHRSKRNKKGMTAKYADYGLMMSKRRPESSHHMQRPHVFLGRRPEQCKAHTRRLQAGGSARGSAGPLLHEGRNQEVSGQGQSRSEQ
jgi:hypothetical protein